MVFKGFCLFYKMDKILIFDFDGVIADSFNVVMKILSENCEKYGLRKIKSKEDFFKLFDSNIFSSLLVSGLMPSKLKMLKSSLKDELYGKYDKVKVFPGIKKVINELGRNNKIFIISSNFEKILFNYLKKHSIKFDSIYGADKEISKIRKIKIIKNKYKNREIYYIGDTKGDVIESRKAGIKNVAVSWGYHPKKRLLQAKPDFIADRPEQLLDILS